MFTMPKYKMNSQMPWTIIDDSDIPEFGKPVWLLAEEETCNPFKYPAIFRGYFVDRGFMDFPVYDDQGNETGEERAVQRYSFNLLDYDIENEEKDLSGNRWHYIAWRDITDHDGTYDKSIESYGGLMNNWIEHDKKLENDHNSRNPE